MSILDHFFYENDIVGGEPSEDQKHAAAELAFRLWGLPADQTRSVILPSDWSAPFLAPDFPVVVHSLPHTNIPLPNPLQSFFSQQLHRQPLGYSTLLYLQTFFFLIHIQDVWP